MVELARFEERIESLPQAVVRYDGVRGDDAGNVERFARGREENAARRCLVRYGREGVMAEAWEGHFGVDLVRDDHQVVAHADGCQSLQCLLGPHDARGVVRIGEDEQLATIVDDGFQLLKIHLIHTVNQPQRVGDHLTLHAFGHKAEGMIDGRLNDDTVTGLCEVIDHEGKALDNPRDVRDPFPADVPPMQVVHPANDGVVVRRRRKRIPEHRVLAASAQRIEDEVRRSEVHVSHPKWHQTVSPEVLRQCVILNRISVCSLDKLIEIILFHGAIIFREANVITLPRLN